MAEKIPPNPARSIFISGNHRVATNAVWAVVARIVYVLAQLSLIAILAWMSDPLEVGTYILVLAVTGPAFMLTNLQLRVVLVTDVSGEFSIASYRKLRFLTVFFTFLCICFASTWIANSISTQLVFCIVALAKAVESISDIHIGLLERDEQIAVSSRSLMLRGILAVTAFSGSFYLWHNLAMACAGMAFAWFMVLLLHDRPATRRLISEEEFLFKEKQHFSLGRNEMASLIKKSWPLGLATMIMSLQVNFPRLWTGHLFGVQALGVFGILLQIAVVGQVVGNALCRPLLPRIAKLHGDKSRQHSYSIYATGIIAILGICLSSLLMMALQPVLQMVLGAQYTSDILLLRILCAIIPIYIIQTALSSVLRAKRRFKTILACETTTLTVLTGASLAIGKDLGLVGPAFAMFIALFSSAVAYLTLLIWDGTRLAQNASQIKLILLRHRYAS